MKFNNINNSLLLFISSFVITNTIAKNACSKEIQEIGYDCCSDNCEVVFSNEDGDWGFENGYWCGCSNIENPTTTNVIEIEPTTTNVIEIEPTPTSVNDCENITTTITDTKVFTTTTVLTTTVSSIVTARPGEKGTSKGQISGGMEYEAYTNNSVKNKVIFNSEDDSFSCEFERTAEIRCLYGPSRVNYDLESSDKDILVNFELGYWEIKKSRVSYVGVYGEFDDSKLRFSIIEILDDPNDYFRTLGYKQHGVVNNYTIYSGNGLDYSSGESIHYKEIFSVRNTPTGGETFTLKKHFNDWKNLGFEFNKLTKLKIFVLANSKFNDRDAAGYVEVQNAFIKQIRQPIDGYERPLNSTQTKTRTPTPTPQKSICSTIYKRLGYDCCPSPCTAIIEDSYGTWGIFEDNWCGCDEK